MVGKQVCFQNWCHFEKQRDSHDRHLRFLFPDLKMLPLINFKLIIDFNNTIQKYILILININAFVYATIKRHRCVINSTDPYLCIGISFVQLYHRGTGKNSFLHLNNKLENCCQTRSLLLIVQLAFYGSLITLFLYFFLQ